MFEPSDNPVLEREQQLAALDDCAREAAGGQGRLVLVSGEAGVGKTTLIEEFRCRCPGTEWLVGACDGLSTPRPLGPVIDMADRLPDELVEHARSGSRRDAVFTGLLERISGADQTCVILIEDIHWADEATLDLIRYLGRRIGESGAMLLLTYRDEAVAAHRRLAGVVGEVIRHRSSRRLELPPLSGAGVTALCRLAGLDERAGRRLHRLTGGNPFFLTEVLRGDGVAVPGSVRDAVQARLSSLSDASRVTLEAAALLGRRVDPHLLGQVCGDEPAAIEDLLRHGLLLPDGVGLRFRHELVRLSVEEGLTVIRRRALHRRILDVLTSDGPADDARLAFHAEGCADRAAVLELAPRAAARAAALGSTREAVAQYRRALRFADDKDAQTRGELCDSLADVLSRLEEFQPALAAREQAIAHWRQLGDVRREADSLRRQNWAFSASRQPEEALATCRRAIDLLAPLGPSQELAWAQAALARVLMVQGAHSQSLDCAQAAQELAGQLRLDDVLSDALNTEASARAAQGLAWEEPMARALDLAQAIPDAPLVARARYNTFCALVMSQRFEEAAAYYPAALAHAVEHDLDNYSRWLHREYAVLQLHMGRWDEALAAARIQADEPSESLKNPILPRVVTSLVTTRRGEGEDVAEMLDRALRTAEFTGMHQYLVPVRLARAEVAWLHGDSETARKEIGLARDLGVEERRLRELTEVWAHRTGLGGTPVGHLAAARLEMEGHAAAAAHEWDRLSCPYDAALALLGSDDDAHLREAVIRLEALGATVPARMARQKMRDHGYGSIPTGRRPSTRTHPKGLTEREQEVLELVAEGLRNRDIAERLFLSPKTVAVHVSNVIRKLEVTSRTEAAAWAHKADHSKADHSPA